MCKNLSRPFILGIDFLRQHLINTCWSPSGKFGLRKHKTLLVESLESLDVKVNPTEEHLGKMYNVQQNMIL